jgi:type II secretory pathway component GspD/PulD (secretin)
MTKKIVRSLIVVFMLGMFIDPAFAQLLDKGITPEASEERKKELVTENKVTLKDNQLISLNYLDVDIRKALSALAMEHEINLVTAKDVSGKISLYLYQVTLDEALEAITLAGGFSYHKYGYLYYVYKPKEVRDPQAERLQMRIFRLKYAVEKVQEILAAIPGIRMVKVHEPSKTIIVEDTPENIQKIETLISYWDSMPKQMRIFRLKYADVEKVQEVLDKIPGMRMIKVHEPSKTIIVEDTPENIQKIETVISYWDRMPRQVMIEAKILEITLTDDMSLGVNWGKILGDVRIGTGRLSTATMPTTEGVSPVPAGAGVFANIITGAGSSQQFTAALDALQTKTRVETLSTPKILAIHGKEASVQVGGKQGYKVTTVIEGVAPETIEFIDTGTILKITPYIDDDGNVLLNVIPNIQSARIEEGIPVVNTTAVSTWLVAKNGETAFIGGLIQDTKTRTRQMIPCLGSIPMLGTLFGRTLQGTGKSELIVLITPYIYDAELRRTDKEAIEKTRKMEEDFKKGPPPSHEEIFDSR